MDQRFISVLISDITIVSLGFSTCMILIPTLKMDERTTTSTNSDDERLPLPPSAPGLATDAASRRQQHTIGAVRTLDDSRSPSASTATPSRSRNDKRQKTAEAREDLCCFCSPLAS